MQILKSLLALGLVAATSASPVAELDTAGVTPAGSRNPCDGGREYCGWYNKSKNVAPQCKCPKGLNWDDKRRKCRAPALPKPRVSGKQKAICAKDKNTWCDYDESDDLCREDGVNVVIVVEVSISITVLKPVIEEECEKPRCAKGQFWNSSEGKCRFPSLPKEEASSCKRKGGRPVCARNPKDFCDYGEREYLCEDDGVNALQCVEPQEDCQSILSKIFAGLDTAVDVFGFDCLNRGGCSVSSGKFDKLCIGADCVAGLLCTILGLVGLCDP